MNVYKPVYLASGNNIHNSLHGPISGGGYNNFGSRLPVIPNGYDAGYASRKYVKGKMAKKIVKKTVINSKTDVNIRKDQPLTVVFNRPKPVIVLDRRPIINVIKKAENSAKIVNKQKVNLVGTVGHATGQKTINVDHGGFKSNVNAGGARVNIKGGNAIGGKAKVKTGDINLNFFDKKPAGVYQRPGMIEAAMAVSSGGFGQVVGPQFAMGGQNIDISSLMGPHLPDVPIVPSVPSPGAFDVMDAIALKTAVARLEQKISGMQHNVNINNNNNNQNNNVNNNANINNDLINNVNGGFDMDNMMMAMMLNGGELSDAMVESMTRKLTGVGGGAGGGSGSGGSGSGGAGSGGGGGTKTIKIGPENTTGKSVVLKVDGNVQISKSNILGQ
ncbi:unnamed protein product [Mytilus coruscus]|uniref:Uncharacterized protein n=1 Tax=Mytilus coruscus TaxID=42192 RepID=A0A6J8C8J7_MYTCO|nr:unnamed protein product [Mytilus coruscus]